jgi:hypothetical protein
MIVCVFESTVNLTESRVVLVEFEQSVFVSLLEESKLFLTWTYDFELLHLWLIFWLELDTVLIYLNLYANINICYVKLFDRTYVDT